MKTITIFGATGSIGQNTLDLVRRNRNDFKVVGLTGASNIRQLAQDALDLGAEIAVTADENALPALRDALAGSGVQAAAGQNALRDLAARPVDLAVSSIIGAAGLAPSLIAAQQGTTLALANKESLVCAGPLLKATAQKSGATILPVDSEHSAIFQALIGEDMAAVERVIITASGGAFRDWDTADLAKATPDQAASHPNWNMGQRITIDSASLFNKAMEVIETKEFFDVSPDKIEVLIHPESLVHALVGFSDGALMAHVGPPDMRHAIGFAMYHPTRADLPVQRLDLAQIGQLTFRPACEDRHPALRLARDVMKNGGLWGAAFNAAKEVAQDRFIAKAIRFTDMAAVVEETLTQMSSDSGLSVAPQDLETVLHADQLARNVAAAVKV